MRLPAPFDSQKYMDSALSFQQDVADAVPCYCYKVLIRMKCSREDS